jgi:hypothetical protein
LSYFIRFIRPALLWLLIASQFILPLDNGGTFKWLGHVLWDSRTLADEGIDPSTLPSLTARPISLAPINLLNSNQVEPPNSYQLGYTVTGDDFSCPSG